MVIADNEDADWVVALEPGVDFALVMAAFVVVIDRRHHNSFVDLSSRYSYCTFDSMDPAVATCIVNLVIVVVAFAFDTVPYDELVVTSFGIAS